LTHPDGQPQLQSCRGFGEPSENMVLNPITAFPKGGRKTRSRF
jgi:hypothetical protein